MAEEPGLLGLQPPLPDLSVAPHRGFSTTALAADCVQPWVTFSLGDDLPPRG